MKDTRIGYTCRGGDPMAFTESECVETGGSWIGEEMPEGTPDFANIAGGGFNNVVDNASSFIQYPGQESLSQMSTLGKGVSASTKMGYTNVSDINLSGFEPTTQVKIKSVLSKVDQLGENVDVCSSVIQVIVDKNMADVPKTTTVLSAYKSASNLISCGDGLDVITKTKPYIDSFISNSNLSGASSIVDRISSKTSSNLFTALPSSNGPTMSCVCHGGDAFDANETDCLAHGGKWVCQEVDTATATTFNADFMSDISSLDDVVTAADGMCSDLKTAVENFHKDTVNLVAKATVYLEKLSVLSNLVSSTDPCGALELLIPDGANDILSKVGDVLSGGDGTGTSCVCHGGDAFDANEADCLAHGGKWVCQEVPSSALPSIPDIPSISSIPNIPTIPTISVSEVTAAVKLPIKVGSDIPVDLNGIRSVGGISTTLLNTMNNKIGALSGVIGSGSVASVPYIPSTESSSRQISSSDVPDIWTKADGSKMSAQEIREAQERYL
jgi:hypothetical protein